MKHKGLELRGEGERYRLVRLANSLDCVEIAASDMNGRVQPVCLCDLDGDCLIDLVRVKNPPPYETIPVTEVREVSRIKFLRVWGEATTLAPATGPP